MWKNARKFLHENFRRAPKKEGFALLDRRNAPVFSGCTFGKFCPFFANFANFFYIFLIFTKMHIFTFFTKRQCTVAAQHFGTVWKTFRNFAKNFFGENFFPEIFSGNFSEKSDQKGDSQHLHSIFGPFLSKMTKNPGGPPWPNWPKLSKIVKNCQKLSKNCQKLPKIIKKYPLDL